jgi:hypothetical protein
MKKATKKRELTINAIGKGAREVYLEKNPHGFSSVTKVHPSKKAYKRREKYCSL